MSKSRGTPNAVEILHRRIIGDDAKRQASLEEERLNARVAQMIYDYRTAADLSQKALATLIGTTQSVISRLENSEYEGHSLSMLERIAQAIHRRVTVDMPAADSEGETVHFAFRKLLANLRCRKGLTVDQLAAKLELPVSEVIALERSATHRPKPLVLHRLSQFYDIPQRHLAELAGAIVQVPGVVREQASRFAAQSDSFAKLSREEQRTLDEFVKFLKSAT